MQTLWQDLRFAVRMLKNNPGFTIVAVVTLAVAIGANAVVFSAMNGLILRALNVPQPQTLYTLEHGADKDASESYPDYLDLRDRNRSFDNLIAYNIDQVSLDTGNNPSRAWVYEVSANYFDALGIQPYLGRLLHPSDEHAPYIVLTYAYWHTHFQDDRNVIGRVLRLNSHPYTVVGVPPPGFRGTVLIFSPDFFVPIVNQQQDDAANLLKARGNRWISEVLGHLKAGVTPAQAVADLNSIGSALEKTYPKDDAQMSFSLERSGLPGGGFGAAIQAFLGGLMLLAGLILLAACANLGSLFAARAADRSREVALRLALGASRRRILRGVFTEAVLISLAGGAVGLLGSFILLRRLSAWQQFHQWPMIHTPVNPDASVYGVALLLAVASGLLFGAAPVRQVLRTNPHEGGESGLSSKVGRRITVRELLLGAQIAICAVLVTSSMVALRGLVNSLYGNYGFDLRNTMVANTDLSMAGYRGDKVPAMQRRMRDAVATIAGVESVGLADSVPLAAGSNESIVFTDKTTDLRPSNATANALMYNISPEYFHA